MKILFFADLHARKIYRNLQPERVLNDVLGTLEEIKNIAQEEKCETVFFLGDLFHRKGSISVELLARVFSSFRSMTGLDLFFLQGNHDLSGKFSILEPFSSLGHVIEKPEILSLGGKRFFCFPYTEGTYIWEKADVFLGHLSLAEGFLDSTDLKLKDEISVKDLEDYYDLGLCGHYHRQQKVGEKFFYIGSALQLSFGEVNQKKFCAILNTESLELEWKELLQARKYQVVEIQDPDKEFTIPENSIVKIILPHDIRIEKISSSIPQNCEYFLERTRPKREIDIRLEANLEMKNLIDQYLDLSKTNLDKEKLKFLGLKLIKKGNEDLKDVGI